ncbi:MAG: hypothetical protein LBQ37_02190 [Elusimicrobiota bacterium]|nr:hypothetical protein [Elusimicrobiota bacterium]
MPNNSRFSIFTKFSNFSVEALTLFNFNGFMCSNILKYTPPPPHFLY